MIDGILEACNYYKIPLIGGDTNEDDEIIISGTALGKVEQSLAKKNMGLKLEIN
ncbi:AIR synthase related protein [Methanobrevibacter arboriphilus]|nr:AIR synthase related protein [Methanobrevibacter arboriphilus]